ncbi:MAG: BPL-N domain-containing protein [Prosthecobacter sp.]|nr:BPL-N domain-containing protein [Prosthecobacter sp.]
MKRLLLGAFAFVLATFSEAAENLSPGLLIPRVSGEWAAATGKPPKQAAEIVIEQSPGHFYLFRSQLSRKQPQTTIHYSTERKNFGLKDKNGDAMHLVVSLPFVVSAVSQEGDVWSLTAAKPGTAELQSAKLTWDEIAPIPTRTTDHRPIRVALCDDYGSFGKGVPRFSELLGKAPDVAVTLVKPPLIREGGLKDFDVVVFTGGSGGKQASTIGLLGREQVRRFVEAGGGYIGVCAGNYLACDGFSWGVKILDAKTKSSKWARGVGDVKIEFTDKGREILGMPAGVMDIRYANGPVFDAAGAAAIGDFEPLAYFRSELTEHDAPKGAQVNSPAMVIGTYGQGRVLCSSPHPEQQAGMEIFPERAVRWVAGKQP